MFWTQHTQKLIKHAEPIIHENELIEVPFEGDACLSGSGVICSKGFLGCIALGGYFELAGGKQYSLLTHRSSNDSENNLARFSKLFNKIGEQGEISQGHIFIFHLDFPEAEGASFIRLPYEAWD